MKFVNPPIHSIQLPVDSVEPIGNLRPKVIEAVVGPGCPGVLSGHGQRIGPAWAAEDPRL